MKNTEIRKRYESDPLLSIQALADEIGKTPRQVERALEQTAKIPKIEVFQIGENYPFKQVLHINIEPKS